MPVGVVIPIDGAADGRWERKGESNCCICCRDIPTPLPRLAA